MKSRWAIVVVCIIALHGVSEAGAQRKNESSRRRKRTKAIPAKSQRTAVKKRDAQQLITAAYKLSKTAKNEKSYTAVIDLCRQLLQPTTAKATKADRSYAKKLLAWSLNRRGEQRAEKAQKLAEQGKKFTADKTDELALSDFNAAVKADPTRWKALHNRGVSLALVGKFSASVKDFTRVLKLNSEYSNAWFNRAEIRYEMGQFEAAISDYDHAIKLKPKDVGAILSRGHAYFRLKQYQNALGDYDKAVRLSPGNGNAVLNRADAYHQLQIWERAAKDFRRAIFLNDRSVRSYQNSAWLMATCPDPRYRNSALAIKAAMRAVALQGEKPSYQSLDALAAAYASHKDFDLARETIAKAIQLAPKHKLKPLRLRQKMYLADTEYLQPIRIAGAKSKSSKR